MPGGHLDIVPNYTKSDSHGKKILVESGHVAAYEMYYVDGLSDEDEGADASAESEVDKSADYHAILAVLLMAECPCPQYGGDDCRHLLQE